MDLLPKIKITFEQFFVTLIVVAGFCYYFWLSAKCFAVNPKTGELIDIPASVSEIKQAIIALVSGSVGYIIASTSSSKRKDEIIANSTPASPNAPAPIQGQ